MNLPIKKVVKSKRIVFLDMDGPLANFNLAIGRPFEYGEDPPEMFVKGFFRTLPVIPGAKEGVQALLKMSQFAIYIGSKFSNKNTNSATEKLDWLYEHFPELARHCMLACDKGLLRGEFLIDDDRKWEHQFKGEFVYFDPKLPPEDEWKRIIKYFEGL